MPKKPIDDHRPWKPAPYEPADAKALQQLQVGEATEDQQKRALNYIVNVLAGTYDLPYYPDSARDSDFAQGKRFVGMQIVKLLKLNVKQIKDIDNVRHSNATSTKPRANATSTIKRRANATRKSTAK